MAKAKGNPAVNASGEAISSLPGQSHGRCRVCGRRLKAYRVYQVYCSPRCRLMAWACRQLVRDFKAGRLPGLEAEITRLR
jgi:predicted nucleic acid-binding Zn ribbon protein